MILPQECKNLCSLFGSSWKLGNLLKVVLTEGSAKTTDEYVVDGLGRRVARRINGAFDRAWLYRDSLRPVSEVDSSGNFTHFVYSSNDAESGAPLALIRGGILYRVVKNHLGSVRMVVNAQTGVVAQSIDYDAYGRVLKETGVGFQPFGFAGGLYDSTTNLVRFGARDYDANTGRWTNKDPILFAGGQSNPYVYVGNDPVNYVDSTGEWGIALGFAGGLAFGPLIGIGGEGGIGLLFDFTQKRVSFYTAAGWGTAIVSGVSVGLSGQTAYVADTNAFWGHGSEIGVNYGWFGGAVNGSTSGPSSGFGTLNGGAIGYSGPPFNSGIGWDVHFYETHTSNRGNVCTWGEP